MTKLLSFAALVVGLLCNAAHAQLRIVNYNVAGLNNSSAISTVLGAIKDEVVNGVVKPIDVLVLNEVENPDITALLGILNAHSAGTYLAGNIGSTAGAGSVGLIYRADTVDLIAQQQVVNTSGSGAARGVMRYTLRPEGYDAAANFYIYGSHYKAGDTASDAGRRNVEATAIRTNSNALGEGAHVIYTGDFNIYRSTESMWATLTGAGAGQAFDPVNQVGNWHDSAAFKAVHTQNPAGSGGVGGGMDDRFDWQMITGELQDNEGMSIISGSYHAFANNNTHTLNGHINTGTGASPTVLNALGNASDHLPVVAQYQVPAKMITERSEVPNKVIIGADLDVSVTVSNSAGDGVVVVSPEGADELDFLIIATGAAGNGVVIGSDPAFGGGIEHTFDLDTLIAGQKSGGLSIANFSPQTLNETGNAYFLTYDVLDHANPSFSAQSDANSVSYDFGTVTLGATAPTFEYTLSNLLSTVGFTSALDFGGYDIVGNGSAFRPGIGEDYLPIEGGSSRDYTATMLTNTTGEFSATLELLFSDEDFLGEANHSLFMTLTGTVVAGQPGDFDNDGDVDGRDFLAWQRGESPNPLSEADLADWQENFGVSALSVASIVVPEPASALLLLGAFGAMSYGRRRC